jgi:transposase
MKGGILMNGYKIVVGVDVSKNSFTATVLYDNKKETFEVKSDPVEFEMKIKPYLKKFKQSDMLIIMEHTGVYHLKLANYLYENDYQVAVVNPFSIKMLRNKRESLSHAPMKRLKENLEYYDELIRK